MKIFVGTILAALCAQSLLALDFGADNPPIPTPLSTNKGFFAGLAEQDTYFNKTQLNGKTVVNSYGIRAPFDQQYLNTLTSEPFLGYNFCDRIGLQLELPVIYREYQTVLPGSSIFNFYYPQGNEYGLSDIRLLGNFGLVKMDTPNCSVDWNATAGIKFPTGNANQLSKAISSFTNSPLGITRADLALGSGSYDGIIGTDISLRWCRLFATAETQYTIRSRGAFEYQYANDLSWYGGPGAFLAHSDDYTLSLQAIVSGDTKGQDTIQGRNTFNRALRVPDTVETGVYLGPQINFTWRDEVSAQLGADLPVSIVTTGIQIVPTYRIHGSVTVWF